MNRLALLVVLVISIVGCAATDAAINTATVAAAGDDRYTELTAQAFAGTIPPGMGLAPVTTADFVAAPKSVQVLVQRLLEALHTNRVAMHSIAFQLNEGPDPATLDLQPVVAPVASDDLLGSH